MGELRGMSGKTPQTVCTPQRETKCHWNLLLALQQALSWHLKSEVTNEFQASVLLTLVP